MSTEAQAPLVSFPWDRRALYLSAAPPGHPKGGGAQLGHLLTQIQQYHREQAGTKGLSAQSYLCLSLLQGVPPKQGSVSADAGGFAVQQGRPGGAAIAAPLCRKGGSPEYWAGFRPQKGVGFH